MVLPTSVIIFALDHRLQLENHGQNTSSVDSAQQELLKNEITGLLKANNVTLIGDEVNESKTSIFESLAETLRVRYVKIDMPSEQRQSQKCSGDYSHPVSECDFPSTAEWNADVARCHELREEYMFNRVMKDHRSGDRVLVLCGLIHQEPLARRFRSVTKEVHNKTLLEYAWFDKTRYNWT